MTKIRIAARYADDTPYGRAQVTIRLVDGTAGASLPGGLSVERTFVTCDAETGEAIVDLTPNEDVTPVGTYYAFTVERTSPTVVRYIEVPQPNGSGDAEIPYAWDDETIQRLVPDPPRSIPAAGAGDVGDVLTVVDEGDGKKYSLEPASGTVDGRTIIDVDLIVTNTNLAGSFTTVDLVSGSSIPRAFLPTGFTLLATGATGFGRFVLTSSGPCTSGPSLAIGDVFANTKGGKRTFGLAYSNDGSTVSGVNTLATAADLAAAEGWPTIHGADGPAVLALVGDGKTYVTDDVGPMDTDGFAVTAEAVFFSPDPTKTAEDEGCHGELLTKFADDVWSGDQDGYELSLFHKNSRVGVFSEMVREGDPIPVEAGEWAAGRFYSEESAPGFDVGLGRKVTLRHEVRYDVNGDTQQDWYYRVSAADDYDLTTGGWAANPDEVRFWKLLHTLTTDGTIQLFDEATIWRIGTNPGSSWAVARVEVEKGIASPAVVVHFDMEADWQEDGTVESSVVSGQVWEPIEPSTPPVRVSTYPVASSGDFATEAYVDAAVAPKIAKATGTAKGSLIGFSASATPAEVTVGSDGRMLMANSNEASGVGWYTPGSTHGFAAGVFTPNAPFISSTMAMTLDRLYACKPFVIRKRRTFDRIGMMHTAGVSTTGVIRIDLAGITEVDGLVGAQLFGEYTLDITATGAAVSSSVIKTSGSISLTLDPGIYYPRVVAQWSGGTGPTVNARSNDYPPIYPDAFTQGAGNTMPIQASVSGAIPSSWTPTSAVNTSPVVYLRAT